MWLWVNLDKHWLFIRYLIGLLQLFKTLIKTLVKVFVLQQSLFFTSFWKTTECSLLKLKTMYWIMTRINFTWFSNALLVTETFCWFSNQVQNLKIVYKNIHSLCYSCYTPKPWIMFSVVVWWICTLIFI